MRFDAFIFDLDGTLLNTLADIAQATNTMLRRHGYPEHPLESFNLFVGSGFRALVQRALPEEAKKSLDEAAFSALVAEGRDLYAAGMLETTRPYEGMSETLEAMAKAGCRLAVLSNKPEAQTAALVEHYFPGLFTIVRGGLDGVPLKPNPASVLALVKDLGISKERVGYVGDSSVDMQTAVNAGLYSFGVTWGFRSEEELVQNGARELAHSPAELLSLVS